MIGIEKLSYAQRQRLQFIESVAYWEGGVDRPRVSRVFSVTQNHVTKDFRLYRQAFPENLDYVLSERIYRPSATFQPKFASGRPEEYLSLLRSSVECQSTALMPVMGEGVSSVTLPAPIGQIEPDVLFAVTRAIKRRLCLRLEYQGLRVGAPAVRTVWPRGLVFAGFRWHIRAYDTQAGTYEDLVLSRILSAQQCDAPSATELPADDAWNEEITIEVIPSTRLNQTQQDVIAKEYGMNKQDGWAWSVPLKRCLIPYFLRVHRFDLGPAESYPIELRDQALAEKFSFPKLN